jgi:4'-phosphopantetheinyl transferase
MCSVEATGPMMTDSSGEAQRACAPIRHWRPCASAPFLEAGELHLWRLDTDADDPAPPPHDLLSPRERERAAAIRHPHARLTYLHSRIAKRRILGGYLGVAPGIVELAAGPRGKPYIAQPRTDLHFNLTHSGSLTLLAVSRDGPLGLDVERVHARQGLLAIAGRMFGAREAGQLAALSGAHRLDLFLRHWTRLEAGIKALGSGLFAPEARHIAGLTYVCFVPADGYLACIATPFALPQPDLWQTLALSPDP